MPASHGLIYSIHLMKNYNSITSSDTLAEWLRRRPAKPMGSPRAGSNPAGVAYQALFACIKISALLFLWSHEIFKLEIQNSTNPKTKEIFGKSFDKVDQLGFEPRAFRMRSGCDTTTPLAQLQYNSVAGHNACCHRTCTLVLHSNFSSNKGHSCSLEPKIISTYFNPKNASLIYALSHPFHIS